MKREITTGVIGVGSLGQHHARIYSEMDDVKLAGVFDSNPERASEIAGKYGCNVFASIEEAACSVDAASIAVPTDHHCSVTLEMIRNNVHLLVEKPIASSTSEAAEMISAAQAAGLILQVGHVERFNPVMKYLSDNLKSPKFIEAIRLAPYPPAGPAGRPRGTEVSVVLDLMIHDIDIILNLVKSPVREIHAIGVPVLSPTEDIANARIMFENGCVANITASRISQERMRKIRVFEGETYVSLDYMQQAGQLYRKTDSGITAEEVPVEKGEPLRNELASFITCVRDKLDPVVSGADASAALKTAVEICELARTNPS